MKIRFVFSRFVMMTGAEQAVIRFANELVRRGHDVTIATRAIESTCQKELDSSIQLCTPRPAILGKETGNHLVDRVVDLLVAPALAGGMRGDTDVVVYWVDNTLPALAVQRLLRRHTCPLVYYCLQPPEFAYGFTARTIRARGAAGSLLSAAAPFYRWMDRRLVHLADLVLVISPEIERRCRTFYPDSNIELCGMGVDVHGAARARPDYLRKKYPLGERRVVLAVGKLIQKKRFDVFVKALGLLRRDGKPVIGVIVGDGPYRQALSRIIQTEGLEDDIILTGYLPEVDDVWSAYRDCDVYVYTEPNVPFGLTPLEAGILAKPVVVAAGGGTELTVKDGITGYVVKEATDPAMFARAIGRLLDDESLRERMGMAGRRLAESFSWAARVAEFDETLSRVVRSHRRRTAFP